MFLFGVLFLSSFRLSVGMEDSCLSRLPNIYSHHPSLGRLLKNTGHIFQSGGLDIDLIIPFSIDLELAVNGQFILSSVASSWCGCVG
jgi:hypothetical protein